MFKKYSVLALSVGALAVTGACTPGKSVNDIGGQFWQRVSVSEAVYQQGPKAQQMLNRDISRCVVELRELERRWCLYFRCHLRGSSAWGIASIHSWHNGPGRTGTS